MKIFQQLDIYHGEWEADDIGCVMHTDTDEDGNEISYELCDVWGPKAVSTAKFIAAAPDLYEAGYAVCFMCEKGMIPNLAKGAPCERCMLGKALKKAGGEEVRDGVQ